MIKSLSKIMTSAMKMVLPDPTVDELIWVGSELIEKPKKMLLVPDEDQLLLSALKLDTYDGIIAGGAARRWYQGQRATADLGDIDIWFRNADDHQEAYNLISKLGQNPDIHSTERATTFRFGSNSSVVPNLHEYCIQLIHFRYFADVQDLFNYFDITVCKVATDGHQWYFGPDFARDNSQRHLRFSRYQQDIVVKRLVKYWVLGYEPTDATVQSIINDPGVLWDFTNTEQDY